MNDDIPIIDIADLQFGDLVCRRSAAALVGRACREIGFFVITGHGVAPTVVADAFSASAAFFAQPLAAKQALAIGRLGHNRGYVGTGIEALDEKSGADRKEALNLIWSDGIERPPNAWPQLPGFQAAVQRYFDALLEVGRTLHTAFAIDLGLEERFFADKLDRPQATLRLLHYPVPRAEERDGQIGAGAHTDYGNVTLLATDGVAGLQVRQRSGTWVDVPALPGAFVCNIGDCLMRWTNDIYVSTPHRVLTPAAERYSIAMFVDPNPDAIVAAIPSCVPAGELPRYPPVSARDYLQQRFDSTYGAR